MDAREIKVTLVLTEPMLGTVPYAPDVYRSFIESKKPVSVLDDEAETVEEREVRGWTGFHKDEKGLFMYDYQVKGMLKELSQVAYPKGAGAGEGGVDLKGLASKIEMFAYVAPRRIRLGLANADDVIERPLRAQTPKGPRVTVVRSDTVAAGREIAFVVKLLPGPVTEAHLRKILSVGEFRGLGQWRNGGYGRFEAKIG